MYLATVARPAAAPASGARVSPRSRRSGWSAWSPTCQPGGLPLGLATVGDGLVYPLLQRRTGLAVGWFPLLAVGTNLAFLTVAAPPGRLAAAFATVAALATFGLLRGVGPAHPEEECP